MRKTSNKPAKKSTSKISKKTPSVKKITQSRKEQTYVVVAKARKPSFSKEAISALIASSKNF